MHDSFKMTVFLIIGSVGLGIVVLSLVLGDLLEGVFESLDIDVGGGVFSTPVIGSFLGAFGFGGAWLLGATDASTGVASVGGVAAGVALGGAALAITRSLMRMPTDEPVRISDLVGKAAGVVSAIPANGFGEISLVHQGQRMKLSARAATPVPTGGRVVIVAVYSPSSVMVESEGDFWGRPPQLREGDKQE